MANMATFMKDVWNPAFQAIRRVDSNAIIQGPSVTMIPSVLPNCHAKLLEFLNAADASNTLPNIVTWHCQDGWEIANTQNKIAEEIRAFYKAHGKKLDGVMCGETVRAGSERNTSPSWRLMFLLLRKSMILHRSMPHGGRCLCMGRIWTPTQYCVDC